MSLNKQLVFLMALATGLAVASNYYVHPLIAVVGHDFGVPADETGLFVTLTQFAYALGLIFLVPLGDLLDNKKLIVRLYGLVGIGSGLTAVAPNVWLFSLGLLLVGGFCTVAQVLVPLAASLAKPGQQGRVVGTIMSGLLLGILLSRTVSGFVAQWFGWRAVYVLGAVLLLLVAAALHKYLPQASRPRSGLSYGQTLKSVWSLTWGKTLLRQRGILGALDFSLFAILWTSLTLLLTHEPYHYRLGTIGLFGLLGALGVFGASMAGRLADKGQARLVTIGGCVLFVVAWLLLYLGGTQLWPLMVGIVLLDFAVQAVHITNQSLIYRTDPALKGRITSGYMSLYFIGGVLGSLASAAVYAQFAWVGVAALGLAVSVLMLVCALMFKANPDGMQAA
ncbi:MFS transporter [Snodgrassella sp. CFCC 13594]|uniref:MFS transporter n=1 Tax=Snodgrassella sp. CFCC 13594 TaxID=1775559 RepID=UPI00082ADE52|nr:MFS transporter [Snodgrassella sp. CFCC 13594]